MSFSLCWFRRDLRLNDNPALAAAVTAGHPVVPVYVSDDLDVGGASRWWLHHSLAALGGSLERFGAGLVIRRGDPVEIISELAADADAVFCTHRHEPEARQQEAALAQTLGDKFQPQVDYLLRQPHEVKTQAGSPFKVFTPFYRTSTGLGAPPEPEPAPSGFKTTSAGLDSLSLADLSLLPTSPDWSGGLREAWLPGEDGALERLDTAVDKAAAYAELRDRPDIDGTSRLSPHLHFGEVSARQVWHTIHAESLRSGTTHSAEMLLRQLYWRDFSWYLLRYFPELPTEPLRSEFSMFPWRDDPEGLKAWQRGRTGYPIVDAGMRQLWQTGWMHNRVRMIVASFLVKHLLIHWEHGADWFMDTLVDADLANNSAGWQWVAGCGTDAAPYFRIFNPISQGKKFDPDGDYVRRYVPELADMPKHLIHEPWLADAQTQQSAGVVIGTDYPGPIVEHKAARQRALDAYQETRALKQAVNA